MATYTVSAYYTLAQIGDAFVIKDGPTVGKVVLTGQAEGSDNMFRVGDHVQLVGTPTTEEIVGFTSDGVITWSANDSEFYLTTNNQDYPDNETLTINTDPFPVCFVRGTLIATDQGAVAVEALAIGDKVMGSTGLRTVKWIGWRHYHAISLHTPAQRTACMPVRISAGALGDNLPTQDLRVSPWHHLFIDNVLVRANDLINGKSIVQETNTTEFSYYHVELDQFDVICAYGVFSESWADGGNRDFFQNVDVTTLRPEDKKRRMADRPGFTALRKPADIAVIHARIAARADDCCSAQIAA